MKSEIKNWEMNLLGNRSRHTLKEFLSHPINSFHTIQSLRLLNNEINIQSMLSNCFMFWSFPSRDSNMQIEHFLPRFWASQTEKILKEKPKLRMFRIRDIQSTLHNVRFKRSPISYDK
jgi:hypothetical protein